MQGAPEDQGGRPGRTDVTLRLLAFGAAVVLLVGLALIAGGVGPWTARPLKMGPPPAVSPPPARTIQVTQPSQDEVQPPQDGGALGWGIRLVFIIVLAIVVGAVVWYLIGKVRSFRRSSGNAGLHTSRLEGPSSVPPPPLVDRESGRDFDPRAAADAIISCWLWVEKAAEAGVFARREQDTPTEFLERFVQHTADADADADADGGSAEYGDAAGGRSDAPDAVRGAAEVLLPLYQRARFDHVALTPDAAGRARQAAETLCRVAGSRSAARAAATGTEADPAGRPPGNGARS